MAETDAIGAPTHAFVETRTSRKRRPGFSAHVNLLSSVTYQRLLKLEPWLRYSIPVLIFVFLITVTAVQTLALYDWHEHIETEASASLALSSGHIAADIGKAFENSNSSGKLLGVKDLDKVLENFRSRNLTSQSTKIAIVDAQSRIVAQSGLGSILPQQSIQDVVRDIQPLLAMGQQAGVIPVLYDDQRALAAFDYADRGGYGVIVFEQTHEIFAKWRNSVTVSLILMLSTIGVFLSILYAYFCQATRAHNADIITDQIQNRIAMAMVRGRCGLWDWNLASGRVYWSRSMYEMLGYIPQDNLLTIAEISSIIHPEDADLYEIAQNVMSGQTDQIDINVPMRHADGHSVWMRIRAERAEGDEPHLVGVSFDVSEQHQYVERTEQADLVIRDAIENISESFVLWDSEGRLVMSNSKYREYTGLSDDIVQPGALRTTIEAKAKKAISEQLIGEDHAGNYTSERQLADGTWLKINDRRTRDGGFVSIGTDISELKRNHKSLEEKQRQLLSTIQQMKHTRESEAKRTKEVAKLNESLMVEKERAESANRSKSEFLANMSHELRTPLNAIIGFSEMMQQSTFGPLGSEKYVEYIEDIHNSGRHLLTLINDILDMSKIEAGRFKLDLETTDLEPIIAETLRALAPLAHEKEIKVTADISAALTATVDARAMRQVFLNLLSNAIKFTPKGGAIIVRAFKAKKTITFTVKDTGVGIPKSAISKLGQPFEQVENQFTKTHTGSGLGLAISRSFIELHGGSLTIESEEGKGTIVHVQLPI